MNTKRIFSIVLLIGIFFSVMSNESDSLVIEMSNDSIWVYSFITIPNCCTPSDSISIRAIQNEFYYDQTQCSDPWHTGLLNSNEETIDSVISFFEQRGIEVHDVRMHYYASLTEECLACACRTGYRIMLKANNEDTHPFLTSLGFKQNHAYTHIDITSYHLHHYPECDCYCQCVDTALLKIEHNGNYKLVFTTIFIDTLNATNYSIRDSVDFSFQNMYDTISHITSSSCGMSGSPEYNFAFYADTLIFYGIIRANCGGSHFLLYNIRNDTINLVRLDTGQLEDCICLYEFEAKIPNCPNDTYRVILDNNYDNGLDTLISRTSVFISTHKLDNNIHIYPNPTNGFVSIDLNNKFLETFEIRIMDTSGRVIYGESFNNSQKVKCIDIGHLQKGIYIIEIRDKTHRQNIKVIKN